MSCIIIVHLNQSVGPCVTDAQAMRLATENAMSDLREELGLGETANIKQCLRILLTRLATGSELVTLNIVETSGVKIPYLLTTS